MNTRHFALAVVVGCAIFPSWLGGTATQETLRYTIVSNGKTQGYEVDMKNGTLYKSNDVYAAVGIKPGE